MSDEPNLAQLLADRKGSRSYDRLAADCDGTPSSGRLHQMATRPLKNFPDPDSIRGMSRGLGVTVTDIIMASARSLELPVFTGNDPTALSIGGAGTLPDATKEVLTTVAREFLKLTSQLEDERDAHDHITQQEPGTQAGSAEHRGASSSARNTGAPMMADKADGSTEQNQALRADDVTLAARRGESEHERRRRLEAQPEDEAQGEAPEFGA